MSHHLLTAKANHSRFFNSRKWYVTMELY